jgi:hypothetical protein
MSGYQIGVVLLINNFLVKLFPLVFSESRVNWLVLILVKELASIGG